MTPSERDRPTVDEFMTRVPLTVACSTSLAEALEIMETGALRHLPVLEHGRPIGVVTERDLLRILARKRVSPEVMTVGEAMTPEPYVVAPWTPLAEVATAMAAQRHGSALVMIEDRLVGIFTAVDGLRAVARLAGRGDGGVGHWRAGPDLGDQPQELPETD